MIEVTLELPEELVKDAEAAGLLTSQRVTDWLQMELQRERLRGEFFSTIRRLHNVNQNEPEMTMDEVNALVNEVRREKRAAPPAADTF